MFEDLALLNKPITPTAGSALSLLDFKWKSMDYRGLGTEIVSGFLKRVNRWDNFSSVDNLAVICLMHFGKTVHIRTLST